MMMHNMKIAAKLTVSFLIVASLTAVVGLVGVAYIWNLHENTKLLNQRMDMGIISARMIRNIHEQSSTCSRTAMFLLHGDTAAYQRSLDSLDDLASRFDELIPDLEKNLILDETRKILNALKSTYAEYSELRDASHAMLKEMNVSSAEAREIFDNLAKQTDTLTKDVIAFTDYLDDLTGKQTKKAEDMVHQSIVILSLVTASAVCAALIFGCYISKIISNPINSCVNRIKMILEKGDVHSDVEVFPSSDETGVLSRIVRYLVIATSNVVDDQIRFLGALGKGDYRQEIAASYKGDLTPLKRSLRGLQVILEENQREIRESEERMRLMLDSMPHTCTFMDANGQVLDCNQSVVQLFDCGTKQAYMDNFYRFSPKYQPDGRLSEEKAKSVIREAYETGEKSFIWEHLTANGAPLPTEINLIRVKWKDDYRVVAYARDLREARENERKMWETARRTIDLEIETMTAQAISEAKSQLLASMSHEIRTPMNAIIGMS